MKCAASLIKIEVSQVGKVVGYVEEVCVCGGEETGVNNQSHRSGHCYLAMRLCHAVHFNIM
jgi:hypothetical protein